MRYLMILIVLFQLSCSESFDTSAQESNPQPKPLSKKSRVIQSPAKYAHRELTNGAKYDPKPRVEPVDAKAGKYELRWIGYDGKEKVVEYQRYDAVDLIVRAKTEKEKDAFIYKYTVNNLSSSSTFLSTFIVQNHAADVNAKELGGVFVGRMSSMIPQFEEGNWLSFGILSTYQPEVSPGRSIDLFLTSKAPPGLTYCRATGGPIGIKGAGEHMPSELESVMPGYDALPFGYTIGPVEKLTAMSAPEKVGYLTDVLPKFQDAGWINASTVKKYQSILASEGLNGALMKARDDFSKGIITGEVYAVIEGLNQ